MDKKPIFINRKIDTKIQGLLNLPEIIAIVGPRQSGKTTYLKHLLEETKGVFLSFEDRDLLSLFNNNIKEFAKIYLENNKVICIDEFQYARDGGKQLKYLYDFYPGKKIIISGSSAVDLTIHAIKYLVGRIIVVNFWPFDFEELKEVFPDKTDLEIYEYFIKFGGYPRVAISQNDAEREEIIKNIYNTYFLRDVKDVLGIVDEYKIQKLMIALASSVGSQTNYKSMSDQCDLKEREVKKYVNFLDKTFVTSAIQPYFTNKLKEIVKQPKVYFYDTGFLRHILGRPIESGKAFEQFVFIELLKKGYDLKYWRDKRDNEVDFILFRDGSLMKAVECKTNNTLSTTSSRSFKNSYPDIELLFLNKANIFTTNF
jgi:predicted AAA+ superfamily ATPase